MSFCADLTDPGAVARPVAVVGAGRLYVAGGRKRDFAFYVTRNRPGADLALPQDRLSQSILDGLPGLFDRQILDGMPAVGLDGFIPWLQDRYRNSLHVASSHQLTIEVRDHLDLQTECVALFLRSVLGLRVGQVDRRSRNLPPLAAEPMPLQLEDGYSFRVQPFEPRTKARVVGA